MKNKLLLTFFLLFGTLWVTTTYGQCTPADSIACPDPENNGQVCPDSLSVAFSGQSYSQSFTIVTPVQINVFGTLVDVDHLKLKDIGNLPQGISWQSNTDDSVFLAGNYYCVLLSGTPFDTGSYQLRIVVEVFVLFNGTPLSIGDVIDSTSLTLQVALYNGISNTFSAQNRLSFFPNPFQKEVRLRFDAEKDGTAEITFYTMQGRSVLKKSVSVVSGKNILFLDGSTLVPGHYVVSLLTGEKAYTGIVSKTFYY